MFYVYLVSYADIDISQPLHGYHIPVISSSQLFYGNLAIYECCFNICSTAPEILQKLLYSYTV